MESSQAPGITALLEEFERRNAPVYEAGKLRFDGVGDRDVYNIAAPFPFCGETLLPGRVEARSTEHATLMLFRASEEGGWQPHPDAPAFEGLQDPCVARICDTLVLGGVRYPVTLEDGRTTWRMDFYSGRTLQQLNHLVTGPNGMKDIRLAGLPDGRVALFSRPHCGPGSRGRIGFTLLRDLAALSAEAITAAPILDGQFTDEEWGGANEVHPLANGRLGVLGHISRMEAGDIRHYYAMVFSIDPAAGATTPPRIIATRAQFPPGPAKRHDLHDVIFSGGLIRHADGTATLYTGLSDVEAGFARIPDPMLEFELQ